MAPDTSGGQKSLVGDRERIYLIDLGALCKLFDDGVFSSATAYYHYFHLHLTSVKINGGKGAFP